MFAQDMKKFSLEIDIAQHVFECHRDNFLMSFVDIHSNMINGFYTESENKESYVAEAKKFTDRIKEFFAKIYKKIKEFFEKIKSTIQIKISQYKVNKSLKEYKKYLTSTNAVIKKANGEKVSFIDRKKYFNNLTKFIDSYVAMAKKFYGKLAKTYEELEKKSEEFDKEFEKLIKELKLEDDAAIDNSDFDIQLDDAMKVLAFTENEQANILKAQQLANEHYEAAIKEMETFYEPITLEELKQKAVDIKDAAVNNFNNNMEYFKSKIVNESEEEVKTSAPVNSSSKFTAAITKFSQKTATFLTKLARFGIINIKKGINFLDRHISLNAAFYGGVVAPFNISYAAHAAAKAACNRQDWDAVNALAKVSNIAGAVGVAGGAYSLHRTVKYAKTGK